MSVFFISGCSKIQTHVLVTTMRLSYRCATLTPSVDHAKIDVGTGLKYILITCISCGANY